MTDAPDLDAIEARANAATKGPWVWQANDNGYPQQIVGNDDGLVLVAETFIGPEHFPSEAEFIAHARTDVPVLVAALREAEARLDSQWDDHDCGQTAADNLERAFEAEQRAERAGKLLERVLMLRMHGEDAPGGTDTWYQLDGDVETYLRSVLDSKGEPTT